MISKRKFYGGGDKRGKREGEMCDDQYMCMGIRNMMREDQ